MNKSSSNISWQNLPDAEERLDALRGRDLEIARIAVGLQMRTRITALEQENAALRAMRESWILSRVSRLYFSLPRIVKALIKKISR